MKQQLRRSLRRSSGAWPREWAHFAISLSFPGVSPMEVQDWDAEEVLDAMAIVDELNADAKRRERAGK